DMRNVPCTLTCITRSNFSSGISSTGAPHVAPLLLTRMSIAPKASSVSFTTLTIPALYDEVTLFLEDPERTLPITWGYLWGTLLAWIGPTSCGTELKGAFG